MNTDVIEYILMILGAVALSIIMLVLYLVVIIASAYAVEWIMDWLSIGIDRTIYWTGVAILILFCAFEDKGGKGGLICWTAHSY